MAIDWEKLRDATCEAELLLLDGKLDDESWDRLYQKGKEAVGEEERYLEALLNLKPGAME